MNVHKQDPLVKEIGVRKVLITNKVRKGPEDELIKMIPGGDEFDIEGDFLYKYDSSSDTISEAEMRAFDRVHTYAACRMILTIYLQAFSRLGYRKHYYGRNKRGVTSKILKEKDRLKGTRQYDFLKKWGKKLEVNPYEYPGRIVAKYTSQDNSIGFGFKKAENIYCCRSFDVIAHEVGHAVLYAIWTKQLIHQSKETIALAEAFCDLTIVFSILAQLDMCESAVVESKGKLLDPNFLKQIAEEYASAVHATKNGERVFFLRNLGKKHYYDSVDRENKYEFSQVFSSAIYGFIVDVFNDHVEQESYDPAETLFRVARFITGATLGAYYLSSYSRGKLTFTKLCKKMISLITNSASANNIGSRKERWRWACMLKNRFKENRIPID
ncbi:MAG: hypothetical protein MI974_28065 [Chitinophagales bacterium]|nr:hypothetical protein [Chitinophagales bacterium]